MQLYVLHLLRAAITELRLFTADFHQMHLMLAYCHWMLVCLIVELHFITFLYLCRVLEATAAAGGILF